MPDVTVYDGVTPDLQRISAQLRSPRGLLWAVGGALRKAHADHWYDRGPWWQTTIARYLSAPQVSDREVSITVGAEGGPILLHKINGGTVVPKTVKRLAIPANPEAKSLGWPRHWSKPGDGQMEVVFGRGGVPVALALIGIREKRLRKRIGITGAAAFRRRAMSAYMKSAMTGIREGGLRGAGRKALVAKARKDAIRASKRGSGQAPVWRGRIMYWLVKSVTHQPDPRALPPPADVEAGILAAGERYLQGVLERRYARNAPAGAS